MKNTDSEATPKLYPVRLINLGVRELSIVANEPPDIAIGANVQDCTIRIGTTNYDPENKTIQVSLVLESGTRLEEKNAPFKLRVELVGLFAVEESLFPVKHISDWATKNAPFILYPYLREHAFGLSSRCGFKPLILPLLEVPTLKIQEKPSKKMARKQQKP